MNARAFSCAATATGAALLLGTAAVLGMPLVPPTPQAALAIVACALVPQLMGHTLLTWALRHTGPAWVAMTTVGEPVGATLLTWWWLNEVPSALVLAGCAVTLVGVGVALMATTRGQRADV